MLLDNRPYTDENDHVDDALITDCDYEKIRDTGEWIRKNIRSSDSILEGRTSYGLKHILERDTGIYLTNNQFKDAMLLAGFRPVDPDELNWQYRIVLTSSINVNPSPFFSWAVRFAGEKSRRGRFAEMMQTDFEFPVYADREVILDYLDHLGASSKTVETFKKLWREYAGKKD